MTPLRLLLNSPFTGANAFIALAEQRGLYRAAGLEMQYTSGHGAYTAASRLADEGLFDAAYGDLNALIELAAQRPHDDLPVAVCVLHQCAPSCITVLRDGPVRSAADLAGKRIVGHASDVALRTFGAYARSAGLDPAAVRIETMDAPMAELLQALQEGRCDAVFGYVTTHTAAFAASAAGRAQTRATGAGQPTDVTAVLRADAGAQPHSDATTVLRFLPYRDVCPALYGSALMVAPQRLREQPDAVAALVRATLDGIVAAQAAPEAAIDAVLLRSPQAERGIEMQRWLGTLHGDIGWVAGAARAIALPGDASEQRLAAGIACLAAASGWRDRPRPWQVFTPAFLPHAAAVNTARTAGCCWPPDRRT